MRIIDDVVEHEDDSPPAIKRDGSAKKAAKARGMIEKLTNWQRNQWARAGYPGFRPPDPAKIKKFAGMKRASR